ncbi:TPA: hypothetical protein ACPSKB_001633 [Legionella feeleii]
MPGSTNKRDIALLDVDNTVLFGAAPNTTYNDNLLDALLEAGVRDIYLFTSMTINAEGVMERQTLANHMESKGFKVHGVITPSDIFWHLDQELMESFLSHFKRPDNSLTKTLLEQDQYSAINFAIESQPGVAFALALNNPESMAGITAHSQAANSVLGLVKKANDEYLTEKGHMYDLFIKHKPEWVNRIIFVDDANDNISAVEKANEKYKCRLFAVLNRDKQNACELPASFYQESFASLIGNHRLRQLLASYCDAKQNNSRQSSSFSWSAFFHKALSPAQEETAIAAVQKALDNEETDLLPHLATLRQGELGSTIRRFVKSGAANALCGKKISTVSELVKALHNQVNGQNRVVFEV